MESERRLAALRQQRLVITGLSLTCFALALIVGLTVWNRRKIAAKNKGLYLQIKQQDSLSKELEQIKLLYRADSTGESFPEPAAGDSRQQKLVEQFHKYLLNEQNDIKHEIDLDKIISDLATNRTYLYEAVKAVTKKTPIDYIYAIRLIEAKQMLETRFDMNVELIAEACGFNSRSTFYRLFREQFQINPTEYRKLAKQGCRIYS
jgi:AraC-like DNA-binding protein